MIQAVAEKYSFGGKFVAMKDFDDNTVVGEGISPQETQDSAQRKGVTNPVIVFVPQSGKVQIY